MNYNSKDINVAIDNGDVDKIRLILTERPDLLTVAYRGVLETPLHYCARYGDLQVFKFLVEQGLDVNISIKGDEVPLNCAAVGNNIEIAKWLLKERAYIDGLETCILSPLMSAITFGHFEMVKLLVDHGANVNRMHLRNGTLALDIAISKKDTRIEEYLRSYDAQSHYVLPGWAEEELKGSGILNHVSLKLGKILPIDIASDTKDQLVIQKLVHANNKKNRVLFTFGLFDFHKPMIELFIVLPEYWNFYDQTAANQFPIQLLSRIIESVKTGMYISEGDYILADDDRFKDLSWPERVAAFYVVDIKWSEGGSFDQTLVARDNNEKVSLYTLMPVKRTKSGFSKEPIEKARLAGWKKLTLDLGVER